MSEAGVATLLANDFADADAVAHELVRFLKLASIAQEDELYSLMPSPIVGAAWRMLITATKLYPQVCCWLSSGGGPIHHDPLQRHDDESDMRERYERTLEAYEDHFLEAPPEDLWPPDFLEPKHATAFGGRR